MYLIVTEDGSRPRKARAVAFKNRFRPVEIRFGTRATACLSIDEATQLAAELLSAINTAKGK